MQTFIYPASDLDQVKPLIASLGSFWARTYTGKDQLTSYASATAAAVAQTERNLLETVAALSRYELPIFHTENWYPLTLKKSQTNVTPANAYRFDADRLQFDTGTAIAFDGAADRDFYAFPAPADFAAAGQIFDRLVFPNLALIGGTDFIVDTADAVVIFTSNPFDIATASRRPVYDANDNLVDEEITLWAFKASFDYSYLFQQFAYAVNINIASSENAKKLVNAIITGLLDGGASDRAVNGALSAIFDVPLVETNGEVVELVTLDNTGLVIATDKQVYRFSSAATPLVAVSDTLNAGDRLTDTFEIINLNRGVVPDTITALALDSGFTSGCYYSDLVFENKDVPLLVDHDHPSGYTYVSFQLAGFPHDIRRFFDELHARGISQIPQTPPECDKTGANKRLGTLAHILDRRIKPAGEPQIDDLPATINPLKFLVENVLRNNSGIVFVRASELGKNHLGLYNIRHIRQLLPPYAALFFIYQLSGKKDAISGLFDVNENIGKFKGLAPQQDIVPAALVHDRGVTVRTLSGTCQ
jgi:hypothetical protein